MQSRWHHLKEQAVTLRKTGTSITIIERNLGIPRSTLSGWLKNVSITPEQRAKLIANSMNGWEEGWLKSIKVHRIQRASRLLEAKWEAMQTLKEVELSPAVLDLAFAMLYLGEGAKSGSTSLASSDPMILRFVIAVLRRNFGLTPDRLKCDLHLRMDQDAGEIKTFWSNQLGVPIENFKYIAFDKRSAGKPTYDHYKGVCVLLCGNVAIQRKLMYLYKLFCERVIDL